MAQNLSFVRDVKTKQMRAGQKAGVYDDSYVSPEILDREAEALALRDSIRGKDERLFDTAMTVSVFADSREQMEEYTETLVTEYKKSSFTLSVMYGQQEEGFLSTLPLCFNKVAETRTLTTSSLALFIPFSTLELNDPEGINYSCNLISRNPILSARKSATATSLAAFIMAGTIPPLRPASNARARQRNLLKSGSKKVSFWSVGRSRRLVSSGKRSGHVSATWMGMRMSVVPRWAFTLPSENSTIE